MKDERDQGTEARRHAGTKGKQRNFLFRPPCLRACVPCPLIFHSSPTPMKYIDPHIHCVSRTTDDYLYMARAGVVAVSEPAFWAGYDRSSASSFNDYFRHLLDVEPKRAARYGIQHYCWLCINA